MLGYQQQLAGRSNSDLHLNIVGPMSLLLAHVLDERQLLAILKKLSACFGNMLQQQQQQQPGNDKLLGREAFWYQAVTRGAPLEPGKLCQDVLIKRSKLIAGKLQDLQSWEAEERWRQAREKVVLEQQLLQVHQLAKVWQLRQLVAAQRGSCRCHHALAVPAAFGRHSVSTQDQPLTQSMFDNVLNNNELSADVASAWYNLPGQVQ